MRAFYVTHKQVKAYIKTNLSNYTDAEGFKNALKEAIADLSEQDKAQIKFYTRVLEKLTQNN